MSWLFERAADDAVDALDLSSDPFTRNGLNLFVGAVVVDFDGGMDRTSELRDSFSAVSSSSRQTHC